MRFIGWLILIVFVYATAPYLAGMLASGADVFTGIHAVAPGDINVYYAMIHQAQDGALVFRNTFSTETTAPVFFNPFWLVVGIIGALFSLGPEWAFHIVRLVSGIGLIVLLWRLCVYFFQERIQWRTALGTILFAHGLGVYALLFTGGYDSPYRQPMDVWVSESSVLYSILHSAHFVVGTLLMVLGMWLLIRALEGRAVRYAAYSGVVFLALFSFHPFHVPTVWLTCVMVIVGELIRRSFSWRRFWLLAVPIVVSSPAVVWYAYATLFDPVASARAAQNINVIPGVLSTILSYGFLLPLAAIGTAAWLQRSIRYRMVAWWGIAHFAILFAPIFFNRRLTQGLDIPMALLAVAGGLVVFRWLRQRAPHVRVRWQMAPWGILALLLFGLSPLFFFAQDMSLIASHQRYAELFYRPAAERDAYKAFSDISAPQDRFFSGTLTGNFFAAQTIRHAYIAHTVETLHFDEKLANVKAFFGEWDAEQRAGFLHTEGIQWIILREEEFQFTERVQTTPGVALAYENSAARIYSVSSE